MTPRLSGFHGLKQFQIGEIPENQISRADMGTYNKNAWNITTLYLHYFTVALLRLFNEGVFKYDYFTAHFKNVQCCLYNG